VELNSHRTACQNNADMTHLTLAFVVRTSRLSQPSLDLNVFIFSRRTVPHRGRIQFLAHELYASCVEKSLKGSSSRE